MTKTTKPLKGVNLGGWLVLERWLTPALFYGTNTMDEKSLSAISEHTRQSIKKHHHEFIRDEDFKWIKEHRLDAVRIPVGYWIFGNGPPFVGSIDRLDFAFEMAEKYKLKILLDIHAAAGSQNGKRHSGSEGDILWHKHRRKTLIATGKLAQRYADSPALWGIELLNEPKVTVRSALQLLFYYHQAAHLIKRHCNDNVRIIISGDGWSQFWAGAAWSLGASLDLHFYHSFGSKNRFQQPSAHFKNAAGSHAKIKTLQQKSPVIIGEWSAVLGSNLSKHVSETERKELMRQYATLQIKSYEPASAWFYWTYKTEKASSWNFRWLVEKKIIAI